MRLNAELNVVGYNIVIFKFPTKILESYRRFNRNSVLIFHLNLLSSMFFCSRFLQDYLIVLSMISYIE